MIWVVIIIVVFVLGYLLDINDEVSYPDDNNDVGGDGCP